MKDGILFSIEKRFGNLLELTNSDSDSKIYILASISHPKLKLSWVPVEHYEIARDLFIAECISVHNTSAANDSEVPSERDPLDKDDCFSEFKCHACLARR